MTATSKLRKVAMQQPQGKMGTQAGNSIPKEREKIQISHEEEVEKKDGPEVSQLQSNKRKLKKLTRDLSKKGGGGN